MRRFHAETAYANRCPRRRLDRTNDPVALPDVVLDHEVVSHSLDRTRPYLGYD